MIYHGIFSLFGQSFSQRWALNSSLKLQDQKLYLWLFNIAMENGPFIDDFPINTSIYKGFSVMLWVCFLIKLWVIPSYVSTAILGVYPGYRMCEMIGTHHGKTTIGTWVFANRLARWLLDFSSMRDGGRIFPDVITLMYHWLANCRIYPQVN